MKKFILPLIIILSTINIIGCSDKSDKKDTLYKIKKNEVVKVGENLPPGTYTLQANEDSLSVSVTKEDGSSLISQFVVNPDGEKFVEYKIKLPKNSNLTTDTDANLIKK